MGIKRYLSVIFTSLIFVSCVNNDWDVANENIVSQVQADPNYRSYSEALEIAENSISLLTNSRTTSRCSADNRSINLQTGVRVYTQHSTRASINSRSNDTLFYVFNFNDDKGFAVVSTNRQADGLIAVTDSGYFDPNSHSGNPGFDTYMDMTKGYLMSLNNNPVESNNINSRSSDNQWRMYKEVYDTVFNAKVAPMLTTRWGQKGITGYYCPNKISGCSNIALAQIMAHYKYPSSMSLTFSGRDCNKVFFDWDDISKVIYSSGYYFQSEAEKQISRFVRQLGELSHSDYSKSGSTGTPVDGTYSCAKKIGYNVSSIKKYEAWLTATVPNYEVGYPLGVALREGKLIWMVGYNKGGDGHAWVIDGCHYVKAKKYLMCTYDSIHWSIEKDCGTYMTTLNHINWGWNGTQNGYFNCYVFEVYNSQSVDPDCEERKYSDQDTNYYKDLRYFEIWK